MKKLLATATAIALLGLSACEQEGPAESLGESIDEATSELRDSTDDLANNIEDACEELKDGMGAKDRDC